MKQGHFKSKKFSFSCLALLVIVGCAVACHWIPEVVGLYATLVGGITGISGLYLAGDVAAQHVTQKSEDPIPEVVGEIDLHK